MEEEKRDRYHVADVLFVIFAACSMGKVQDVNYDEDGNRVDTRRGGIFFLVGTKLPSYSEVDFAAEVFPDVRGPQSGKLLPNRPEGVFHCARSDALSAGSNSSIAVSLPIDLEDGYRIQPSAQERVNSILDSECIPSFPMLVLCFGSLSSESGFVLIVNKAEVSAESISLRRVHIVQG
jgi:hypothetical protein